MYSLCHTSAFNEKDVVIQTAACTFDIHVLDILGSLFFGATVVMLHPYGNMDFVYLTQILQDKQITYIVTVPTFLSHLCDFVENMDWSPLSTMRSICSGGQ
jgi:acyl-coenzyme A synthetase/AMP-(fatty) acid ligase